MDGDITPQSDFLSPKEFAHRSGLSLVTVRRYLKRGIISSVQPAGYRARILIPISALTDFFKTSAGEPTQAPFFEVKTASKKVGPRPKWTKRI